MSSLAGFQGSGFLATYAATKSFLKVLAECLRQIGTTPSFVGGSANKWITFFMKYILSKKAAIRMMSNGLKTIYRIIPLLTLLVILPLLTPPLLFLLNNQTNQAISLRPL
jgi:hypothetical protein